MTTDLWTDEWPLTDGNTRTGSIDGATWTVHGDDITLTSTAQALRMELANAITNEVNRWGVTVTPYPTRPSPPAIYIDQDTPFFEHAANQWYVWAYKAVIVIAGRHPASHDWFERIAPQLVDACTNVPGAQFHTLDGPEFTEVGDDKRPQRWLVAEAHITIKRPRS